MKKHFEKGDIIRTNPMEGYFGIAVVLETRGKTEKFNPMCHIAITPLMFKHEVSMEELDLETLKPLSIIRKLNYTKRGVEIKGEREDLLIDIYATRNKPELTVIGNIDPSGIYTEPLLWEPQEDRFHFAGTVTETLGIDAYNEWAKKNI